MVNQSPSQCRSTSWMKNSALPKGQSLMIHCFFLFQKGNVIGHSYSFGTLPLNLQVLSISKNQNIGNQMRVLKGARLSMDWAFAKAW